jgi:hypothetical protein
MCVCVCNYGRLLCCCSDLLFRLLTGFTEMTMTTTTMMMLMTIVEVKFIHVKAFWVVVENAVTMVFLQQEEIEDFHFDSFSNVRVSRAK